MNSVARRVFSGEVRARHGRQEDGCTVWLKRCAHQKREAEKILNVDGVLWRVR